MFKRIIELFFKQFDYSYKVIKRLFNVILPKLFWDQF